MYETGEALVVRAALPGVRPEDIEVSLRDGLLTIRAQRGAEEAGRTYHLREMGEASFCRALSLPVPVEAEGAEAVYERGVLTVTLPKAATARARVIKVRARELAGATS